MPKRRNLNGPSSGALRHLPPGEGRDGGNERRAGQLDYFEEAKAKLAAGRKAKLDRYGEAMKGSVADALLEFCRQDGEFSQAVAQGGSFEDCMQAVGKCVKGNSISDAEAWGAAVRFYFPGAEIRVTMRIDLCAGVDPSSVGSADTFPQGKAEAEAKLIDLSEFF